MMEKLFITSLTAKHRITRITISQGFKVIVDLTKNTDSLMFYKWKHCVFFLIIISAKSSPSLFLLLTHQSVYPNSESPA